MYSTKLLIFLTSLILIPTPVLADYKSFVVKAYAQLYDWIGTPSNLFEKLLLDVGDWLFDKLMRPAERFELVNGRRVCYVRVGNGPHTLLLVPGLLGTWVNFYPQLTQLDLTKYTLIAVDPAGFGESTPLDRRPPPESFEEDARIMHRLMQQLDLVPYSVLGWSEGGITALLLAYQQRNSSNVNKLVLGAAYCRATDAMVVILTQTQTGRNASVAESAEGQGGWLTDEYARRVLGGQIDGYTRLIKEENGDICSGVLKDVPNEVLIIHGAADSLVPLEHATFIYENLPNAHGLLVHPTYGHSLYATDSSWFNEKIAEFLVNGIVESDK